MNLPEHVRKEMQRQGMPEETYDWIIALDHNDGDIIGDVMADEVSCVLAEPPFTFWWNRDDIKLPAWECDLKRDGDVYGRWPFIEKMEFNNASIKESIFWNDTSFGINFSGPLRCLYTQGYARLRNLKCSL